MTVRAIVRPIVRPIVRAIAGGLRVAINPNTLAAANSGSAWDCSDITKLFQNTAGTTPVTAAGQTVKCIKDTSGRGFHLTNATGDLYQVDANGVGYVQLSGTTGASWTTTSSTAAFNYLHNGTGGSVFALLEKDPDAAAARTLLRTGTAPGIKIDATGTGLPNVDVRNATVSAAIVTNPLCYPFGPGARRFNVITFDSTNGLKLHADGNATAYSTTAQAQTPSSSNANQSLFIGSTMKGKLFFLGTAAKVLSAAEHAGMNLYFAARQRPMPVWTHAFAICGQSNADGQGVIDASIETASLSVGMYDKSDKFRIANEPIGDRTNWIATTLAGGTPAASFPLKMAKDIAANTATKPLIVPHAIGGTSMANWTPTADRFDRLTLYGAMNTRMRVLANMNSTNPPVFCWFGHEADTGLPTENLATGVLGTEYSSAFFNLMAQVRQDYPNSPILFAQISQANGASANSRRSQESLRRCEASYGGAYAVPNSYMIVTHDVQRNAGADSVHLSEAGQIEVGRRFALVYRQKVLGEVGINGIGPRLVSVTNTSSTVIKVKFDKQITANASNWGGLFRVYDSGVEKTVSSAVIDGVDNTALNLTVSVANSGTVVVTYGELATADNVARANVVIDTDSLPAPVFGPVVAT